MNAPTPAGRAACALPAAVALHGPTITPCGRHNGHGGRCRPPEGDAGDVIEGFHTNPHTAEGERATFIPPPGARSTWFERTGIDVHEDPTMPRSHFELRHDGTVLARVPIDGGGPIRGQAADRHVYDEAPALSVPAVHAAVRQIIDSMAPRRPSWRPKVQQATPEAPSALPRLHEAATGPTIGQRPAGPPEPPIDAPVLPRHWTTHAERLWADYARTAPSPIHALLTASMTPYEPPPPPTAAEMRARTREALERELTAHVYEPYIDVMHPAEWERRKRATREDRP